MDIEGLDEFIKTLPTRIYLDHNHYKLPNNISSCKTEVRKQNGQMIMATEISGTKQEIDEFIHKTKIKPLNNITIIKYIGF